MSNWALWLIHHRLAWPLKSIVVLSFPLILLGYLGEALNDAKNLFKNIDLENA